MNRPIPERAVSYMLHGLAVMPQIYDVLLRDVTAKELDVRPFADRFTLREAISHVADWEGVWTERIQKIATEETPFLPGYDEGQWAIDHDYARADFDEQMANIAGGRAAMVSYLRGLEMPTWQRVGQHGELGAVSLFELVALVSGHDGYHAQQIIDYRSLTGTGTT